MRFGKNKGCDFINEDCDEEFENKELTFANEFYLHNTNLDSPEPSCSSGRLSKTFYITSDSSSESEPREIVDSCIISEFNGFNSDDIYIGHCSKENIVNEHLQDIIHESFTPNSFCVLSSLISQEHESEKQIRAVCHEMFCSSKSLTIKIGQYYFVCPRSGGRIEAENLNLVGYLLCPDYNLICTGKEVCNNNYDCFINHSEEKEESFYYEYEIKTTQNSAIYDTQPAMHGYELSENGSKCPYLCSQCNSEKTCFKCAPHFKPDENNNNKNCIEKDPNCEYYANDDIDRCDRCKTGYSLVKEDNDIFLCVDNNYLNHYYLFQDTEDPDLTYRIRCHHGVENCDICQSDNKCTGCISTNYVPVNDGAECGDLSTKQYYWDAGEHQYKYCQNGMNHCNKCQLNDNNDFECLECETNYALFHEETEPIECTPTSSKTLNNYYTEDEGKNYYLCSHSIPFCNTCDNNKERCSSCLEGYDLVNNNDLCLKISEKKYYQDPDNNNYYFICSTSLNNCLTCDSKIKCNICNDGYVLEESNICIPYSDVIAELYYLDNVNNKYISCSKLPNCQKCTTGTNCKTCNNNFAIIGDDRSKCEDLSTKKYYRDTDLNQYKPCSYKLNNCETCSIDNNNQFICETCSINYALKYNNENNIECSLKSELGLNNEYYTTDSGMNYYSCINSLYNDVSNCKECSNKNSCSLCQTGYRLLNNDRECINQVDIDNNIYIYNPDTKLYSPCSDLIQLCHKCNNVSSCTECGNDGALEENNTCISIELVENHYYFKDETTNKYVSCSNIDNCITCNSSTVCTECKEEFEVKNSKCQKKETQVNDKGKDNKLSTGAIVGIVFGCLGFLLIIAGGVYFFLNKFKNAGLKNDIGFEEQAGIKVIPDNNNDNAVKSTKRSIHN